MFFEEEICIYNVLCSKRTSVRTGTVEMCINKYQNYDVIYVKSVMINLFYAFHRAQHINIDYAN